jgi:hypothetical protein
VEGQIKLDGGLQG